MNQLEAEQMAQDWKNMHDDATCEEENGCESTAIQIRDEAKIVEQDLEAAGYSPSQLLRNIEARRRDP